MSRGLLDKMEAAASECGRHADILREDLAEQGGKRYSAGRLDSMTREHLRLLDQMAYRFGKLQTTLGERLLPLVLEALEEPIAESAPFAQKLQRLERLGTIPSAEQWRVLRQVRNSIAHEYPDAPKLRAASLNHFIEGVGELLVFWNHVSGYLAGHSLVDRQQNSRPPSS